MNFESYRDFKVEDFAVDAKFVRWVIEDDQSQDFFWKAFSKKYPEKKAEMELAKSVLKRTQLHFSQQIPPDGSVQMPAVLENKIKASLKKNKGILPVLYAVRKKRHFLKYAAAACLLLVISLYGLNFISNSNQKNIEYVAGNAEWKRIELPDGSIVELNANSQLSVLENWDEGRDRKVWLRGEAFFKVKKKPSTNAKFVVQTKDLQVEVLGTSFNVNTRTQKTKVFLEEGKVVLNLSKSGKKTMKPGDQITYSQKSNVFLKSEPKSIKKHSNWKNGVYTIHDKSIEEILNEIEIIYGLDFILNSKSLESVEGSLSIPVDNLPITLSIIERTLNVKVERYDKQVFISAL